MAFFQDPPRLDHPFHDDRVLSSYLARALPDSARKEVTERLVALGELSAGRLFELMMEDRLNEPKLVTHDAWGRRVDRIELTRVWQEARKVACEYGLVATPYDKRWGEHGRPIQAALIHLFHPSTDVYSCPLAMSDGAAKTLLTHHAHALAERAISHLTSRDAGTAWTSGQWMTERTGGSDVGLSETEAHPIEGGKFQLFGTKWFTSAATSEMALTLARPPGAPSGGRGLALFYLEVKDAKGLPNHLVIHRLKEKLGTRKLPTGEIELQGTIAEPVAGLADGVRNITPMLAITRYWNSVCAVSAMRRGISLARDFSRRRVAFGSTLSERPLHLETLAGLQAEYEGAFHFAMAVAELLGREEASSASEEELRLLRLLTPLCKLTTGKQVVSVVSEVVEVFAGAGYCEDTGIPMLLRDAQVFPLWEGTTNVLSLDALRAIAKDHALPPLLARVRSMVEVAKDGALAEAGKQAIAASGRAAAWLSEHARDQAGLEAGARGFAMTLGRSFELAAMVRHAQWSLDHERDGRARAAALRFARHGVDRMDDRLDPADARALANDQPLPMG